MEGVSGYSGVVSLTPGKDTFGDREAVIAFCRHYGIIEDNSAPLLAELDLLEDMFRRGGEDLPSDLLGLFKFLLPHNRIFYRIHKAVKIGATLPVTSASSERSFSALRASRRTCARQCRNSARATWLF